MTATFADQTFEPSLLPQEGVTPYLVLEYLYRDASNYKAFGELWLIGSLSKEGRAALVDSLDSGEFFVAEQLGVPPLYEKLGERTVDDHAWHTFVAFRGEYHLPSEVTIWGKAIDLKAVIVAAEMKWKPQLSPNFDFLDLRTSDRQA